MIIDPPSAPPEDDPIVCFCHNVTRGRIEEAIRQGAGSLYDVQLETRAATGCGGCECDVLDLLEKSRLGSEK